jgi:UDP-3-O-[3-hydroxymyristoyl] glucosamine N-acyltransferase
MVDDNGSGHMNTYRLDEIAQAIGAELEGSGAAVVRGMAALGDSGADQLAYAQSAEQLQEVMASAAAGVIVGPDFPVLAGRSLLRVDEPKTGFVGALELFVADRTQPGVHPAAFVANGARLGAGVGVGPCAVIEADADIGERSQIRAGSYIGAGVRIGVDCDIGANAVLLDGVRLGDRCILHPGVVIGADGYGFHWMGDHHHKIPQLGKVVIEDDVEIGANTCIDRATLGETRIGRDSKFDNLVHIAHNNRIGEHALLAAQVGIAGSSTLGNGVVAGGQAGIADHLEVGDGVQIGAQGGVIGDLDAGSKVWGTPARPIARVLREQAALGKLPEILKLIRRQEKELRALRDRIAALEPHEPE